MMFRFPLILVFFFFLDALSFSAVCQENQDIQADSSIAKLSYGSYQAIHPPKLQAPKLNRPVVVAVVDDAFRLSHQDFEGFIFENPDERPENQIDDDGNGKIDDYQGWDIADQDKLVSLPDGLSNSFYHGTFICSSITTVLKMCFGEQAKDLVKILPVKVLSDFSRLPDYSSGYLGIEYAIGQEADIICCAWSGGQPTEEQKAIVQKALDMGIIVIGAAGNAYSSRADPPGSLPGVLTVGGLDSLLRKTTSSNYGPAIDLVGPAQNVKAAYPLTDNSYFYGEGTSGATGIVSGCAAVLKALRPEMNAETIKDALINTARPVENTNQPFTGRLGAGIPDLTKAVRFIQEDGDNNDYFINTRPEGKIFVQGGTQQAKWELSPNGTYHGFNFFVKNLKKASQRSILRFYTSDTLWYDSDLKSLPKRVFIPGSKVSIEYERRKIGPNTSFELQYEAVAIDSTTIFCSDIRYFQIPEAEFSDGSGLENYANNCSCKWQITAPEGQRIKIEFSEFQTQGSVDFVYLFDGESTIPGNMIAKFSGPDIPMIVTSRTNKVLVWFVTDASITDQGWVLKYHTVEDCPLPQ